MKNRHSRIVLLFVLVMMNLIFLPTAHADCPNGNIQVTFPDGAQTTVPDSAGCCYKSSSCRPCKPNPSYQGWAKEHFDQCKGGECLIVQQCPAL